MESGVIDSLGIFRMQVSLPGGMGDTIGGPPQVAIESESVPGMEALQTPKGFPPAHLRSKARDGSNDPRATIVQLKRVIDISTLNDKLRAKNSRVEQWLNEKVSDEEAIRRLFFLSLCRQPTDHELSKFKTLMSEAAKDSKTTRRDILEDLFWAVLSSKEFMFNH